MEIDTDVTNQRGIYEFVLGGSERCLNIRAFSERDKRRKYGEQGGKCVRCGKDIEYEKCHRDHITPSAAAMIPMKKLDLDAARKPALSQALEEAMLAQPKDMRGIYVATLRDLPKCCDRIHLTKAQSGAALELYGRAHGGDAACQGMLRQLTMTRKQYQATCG